MCAGPAIQQPEDGNLESKLYFCADGYFFYVCYNTSDLAVTLYETHGLACLSPLEACSLAISVIPEANGAYGVLILMCSN